MHLRFVAFAFSMTLSFVCAWASPARAADPAPEVKRDPYPPAPNGVVQTIRIIPETCAYLQGMFTGDKQSPYRYGAKRTSPRCQPRAQLVDPAKAAPSVANGWILNDVVRIPSAACPSQTAVIRIWRKPADNAPPPVDAQGKSRIYLDDVDKPFSRTESIPKGSKFVRITHVCRITKSKSSGGWQIGCPGAPQLD